MKLAISAILLLCSCPALAQTTLGTGRNAAGRDAATMVIDSSSRRGWDAWMLITKAESGAVSIKTGLTRDECTIAAVHLGMYNPSDRRYTYQMPEPRCEQQGLRTLDSPAGTQCDYTGVPMAGRVVDTLGGASGGGWRSVQPSDIREVRCLSATTGEEARDLRRDDMHPGGP